MPENTGTPGTTHDPVDAFADLHKAGQCLFAEVDSKVAEDVAAKIQSACTIHDTMVKRLEKVEGLLEQVNSTLDRSTSIFPRSPLHEYIHLAVTRQRL